MQTLQKRHHQSICDTLRETKREAKNEENAEAQQMPDDSSKITTATSYGVESKRNCVLLQTARAMAVDENREYCVPVRILLDTGSQQSYVTENLCSKLNLKAVKQLWILSGPTSDLSSRGENVSSHLCISGSPHSIESNDEIVSVLIRFWETDSIGIENDHDVHQEKLIENEIVKPVFNDEDNHYEVGLPWKEDYLPSSSNYRLCETRLRTLHYKLKNESNLLSDYHQITKDQEIKGVVERVDESNNPSSQSQTRVHYSPHHAVIRKERGTTKVCIVYDGSAKQSRDERSLNDCLEIGENYIPHVFDQIIKFRWNAIGLIGDIEKAFLQVGINPEDRDMLRFLWYEDPFSSNPKPVVYRFNRLVFALRLSPSILGATIEHHLRLFEQSEPEIAELLKDSLYVNDLITGEENDGKAFNVYKKSKDIMSNGGFNLRKWRSSSSNLLKLIKNDRTPQKQSEPASNNPSGDDESYAKSQTTIGRNGESNDMTVKDLGLNWDTVTDEFFFE